MQKLVFLVFICLFHTKLLAIETHYILHFPPYWSVKNSHISGLHADLVREIYREAKLDVKLIAYPYSRISKLAVPPGSAFIAYGENSKTDSKLLFPIPKTQITLSLFSFSRRPEKDLRKITNETIVIVRGFPLANASFLLKSKTHKVIQVKTAHQAIRLLLHKRATYVLSLNEPFISAYNDMKITKDYKSVPIFQLAGWPIAILKSHKNSKKLYDRVKAAYERLLKKGEILLKDKRLLLTEDHI